MSFPPDEHAIPEPPAGAWRIVVSGKVQRVGYRKWAQQRAREHGLNGWIRNRSDGRVETRVQGDTGQLGRFLGDLHSGPRRAHVTRVSTRLVEATEETGFRVRSTRTLDQAPSEAPRHSRVRRLVGRLLAPARRRNRRRT